MVRFLRFLALAFDSRLLTSPKTTLTDFSGHLPRVFPNSAACPVLPIPPKCLVQGTHLLCLRTSLRYCLALAMVRPLTALAVSQVFLQCTLRSLADDLATMCMKMYPWRWMDFWSMLFFPQFLYKLLFQYKYQQLMQALVLTKQLILTATFLSILRLLYAFKHQQPLIIVCFWAALTSFQEQNLKNHTLTVSILLNLLFIWFYCLKASLLPFFITMFFLAFSSKTILKSSGWPRITPFSPNQSITDPSTSCQSLSLKKDCFYQSRQKQESNSCSRLQKQLSAHIA